MAKVVWAEPALSDLDAIADYIALDNPGRDTSIRLAPFNHVQVLTEAHGHLTAGELKPGFTFQGERVGRRFSAEFARFAARCDTCIVRFSVPA